MSKITKIPSESRNILSKKGCCSVMDSFSRLLESLHLDSRFLGGNKRENYQLTNLHLFQILVLMPFFAIKGFFHYPASVLSRMFGGKKDVLYSFMSQDNINWRHLIYRIVVKLIAKVTNRQDFKKSHFPVVLIADDSDLPQTGIRMEAIGKIFSHVHQTCILGWSDGRTQFMLDASLHGEKVKVKGKELGLSAKQRQKRCNRKLDENSHVAKRKEEYFISKGKKLIEMVRCAIKAKILFEYLLVDSWFTCSGLVDFVYNSYKKFHLLGVAKMGNTKYSIHKWGEFTGADEEELMIQIIENDRRFVALREYAQAA